MWFLFRAAVKHVQINIGQLRIKLQIDSQLLDSNFAAYVQAWLLLLNFMVYFMFKWIGEIFKSENVCNANWAELLNDFVDCSFS